jgi:hypothetical protein
LALEAFIDIGRGESHLTVLGAATDVDALQYPVIDKLADSFLGDLPSIRNVLDREKGIGRSGAGS